jgi:hypothetical protein
VTQTTIRIRPSGRLANLMSQLMFADTVSRRCRQPVAIEGYCIPDWGLLKPPSGLPSSNIEIGSHLTRAALCSSMIDAFKPELVHVVFPIFRVGNLGNPKDYFSRFPFSEPVVKIPDDYLLIHIRAGDVAMPTHEKYGPLPIRYYEYLISKTGLRPLFISEPGSHRYIELIRTHFPKAEMIGGSSAINDFQTIRAAKNVALAVSSFCWMAAFLSITAERIHLPLAGHFDPVEDPYPDFLPLADRRYVFHHVSREAWSKRYEDPVGPRDGFSVAGGTIVRALKTSAIVRTARQSAKIHGGLLRRMATLASGNGKQQ